MAYDTQYALDEHGLELLAQNIAKEFIKNAGTVGGVTQPVYLNNGTVTAANSMCDLSSAQTVGGVKTFTSNVICTSSNAFRAIDDGKNYGFFVRNDGSNVWFMMTNSGDTTGGYNDLRPFRLNCATGTAYMQEGCYIGTAGIKAGYSGLSTTRTGGYIRHENGLIFQWGYASVAAKSATNITFPISFKSGQCAVVSRISGTEADTNTYWPFVRDVNNVSYLQVYNTHSDSLLTAYFAWGS